MTNPNPCPWIKGKWHHGEGERSQRPSTWRCALEEGHKGGHKTAPSAHQSNIGTWHNPGTGEATDQGHGPEEPKLW